MKAFEKWHEQFEHKSFNAYWHRKAGWVSALRWVSKGCEKKDDDYCLDCLCFDAVIDFIDEELEEIE